MARKDFVEDFKSHPKVYIAILLIGVAFTTITAFFFPRRFVAETTILPPQAALSGNANALAQVGMLVAGGAAPQQDELYSSLLKTRSALDYVLAHTDVKKASKITLEEDAREVLLKRTSIVLNKKSGLIGLTYEDESPERAALVANTYFAALKSVLNRVAVTEAKQRLIFLLEEVDRAEIRVSDAERRFLQLQERFAFRPVRPQVEADVRSGVEAELRLKAKQAELSAMKKFATDNSIEVKRLRAEIDALGLASQSQKLSKTGQDEEQDQVANSYRNYVAATGALDSLKKHLEIARVEAAKEAPLLQQVDVAKPPQKPSKPALRQIVVVGSSLTLLAMLVYFLSDRKRRGET
ncbi:hypothetical protein [Aquabacterium olei]|nr:hypothetical protein [Aquabacterium olei]